ncbi:MAG: ABC transporter substrate-binding protein/permease [Candidatus Kapaibacteriales bacterium]
MKHLLSKYIFSFFAFFFCFSAYTEDEKIIRWAADTESGAPYVFEDPANPTKLIGFEAEIINAIAKSVGYKTKFVQNSWDGLIPGIKRDDYDVAINGLEITGDRAREVNFSEVYYITYEQIVTRSNTNDINKITDLFDRRVGTLKGSLAERILNDHEDIIVVSYPSEVASFKDLRLGQLDAVLIDEPVAKYYASWRDEFQLVGGPIGEVNYGMVVKDDDYFLDSVINKGLNNIIRTGELRSILERYGLWNPVMAKAFNDETTVVSSPEMFERFVSFNREDVSTADYFERIFKVYVPKYLPAALNTIKLTILSMILAIILGLILALSRVYGPKPIAYISISFIELIRGTPLLVQLFLIYYGLPEIGIKLNPITAGILGLGINYAAYEAENYRAGLDAVPKGQMEAAISLGMTKRQSLKHVILPQAIRLVIPPMTNDFISLLKDSSLVSVITIVELTNQAGKLTSTYYDPIGALLTVAAMYLLIGLPFVWLSRKAERKFNYNKKKKEE